MKSAVVVVSSFVLLSILGSAVTAAPITDPNDPRTWQGASLETFRSLLGYSTLQELVDARILDDGVFPSTSSYGLTFTIPELPCGIKPVGIEPPTYIGQVQGCSGSSTDPATFAFTCGSVPLADYAARGRCLDMWWIQDTGDGDLTTGLLFDLGGPSNQVAVFPIADEGPLPQDAMDYTVYLSNDPNATAIGTDGNTQWVLAQLDKLYLEGWTAAWIADGFTTVWRLPDGQTFRYANVVAGGPESLIHNGSAEIDAVIGLTAGGDPVCPAATDRDGDGVCDDSDNCPDLANALQEDDDHDGVGNACENCGDGNATPEIAASTPACGAVLVAAPGTHVSINVGASDDNTSDVVTLSVSGLPPNATLTPALPTTGNPVNTVLDWTPVEGDVGDHTVLFAATDPCGARSECSVTIRVSTNALPDCSNAAVAIEELWPPNHRWVEVPIDGITDADGDPITVQVTAVTQDESTGDDDGETSCIDAFVGDDGIARVRAERSGNGNGRVYRVWYTASDGNGGECSNFVTVCVPHDRGHKETCIDDGLEINSLGDCTGGEGDHTSASTPTFEVEALDVRQVRMTYTLPEPASIGLAVFDIAGRRVATIEEGAQPAGTRTIIWSGSGLARSVYFVQLRVGSLSFTKRLLVLTR